MFLVLRFPLRLKELIYWVILDLFTCIVYAMKQSMAPLQSSNENPPKRVRQNLIHSGTVGGGVRLLKPYFALPSVAASLVKPDSRLVLNLLLKGGRANPIKLVYKHIRFTLKRLARGRDNEVYR
jgi:hypothetical protein